MRRLQARKKWRMRARWENRREDPGDRESSRGEAPAGFALLAHIRAVDAHLGIRPARLCVDRCQYSAVPGYSGRLDRRRGTRRRSAHDRRMVSAQQASRTERDPDGRDAAAGRRGPIGEFFGLAGVKAVTRGTCPCRDHDRLGIYLRSGEIGALRSVAAILFLALRFTIAALALTIIYRRGIRRDGILPGCLREYCCLQPMFFRRKAWN